jgi:hypothetical protein
LIVGLQLIQELLFITRFYSSGQILPLAYDSSRSYMKQDTLSSGCKCRIQLNIPIESLFCCNEILL